MKAIVAWHANKVYVKDSSYLFELFAWRTNVRCDARKQLRDVYKCTIGEICGFVSRIREHPNRNVATGVIDRATYDYGPDVTMISPLVCKSTSILCYKLNSICWHMISRENCATSGWHSWSSTVCIHCIRSWFHGFAIARRYARTCSSRDRFCL